MIIKSSDFGRNDIPVTEYRDLDKEHNHKAMGEVINIKDDDTLDFFNNIADLGDIHGGGYIPNSEKAREIISTSNKLYVWDGVCATVVDAMVDFANCPVDIVCPQEESSKVFKWWVKNINNGSMNLDPGLDAVKEQIFLELLVSGNYFGTEKWETVEVEDGKSYTLPMLLGNIDPLLIDIKYNAIKNEREYLFFRDNIQEEDLIGDIEDSEYLTNSDEGIAFKPDFFRHIKYRGKSYQHWGTPYLMRAFLPIKLKLALYNLDMQTVSGMMNLVWIFKIGTDEFPAEIGRLRSFANLLRNKKTASVVWGHDVEAECVGAKGEVLDFEHKYQEANLNVSRSLGFSYAFIDGSGDGRNIWLSTIPITERLKTLQRRVRSYLIYLCNKIVEKNEGIEYQDIFIKDPTFTNETFIKALVLGLYDRGLLSKTSVVNTVGYDIDVEAANKEIELGRGFDDIFIPPDLPYGNNSGEEGGRPDKTEESDSEPENNTKGKGPSNYRRKAESSLASREVLDLMVAEIFANDSMNNSAKKAWAIELLGNTKTLGDKKIVGSKKVVEDLVDYSAELLDKIKSAKNNSELSKIVASLSK